MNITIENFEFLRTGGMINLDMVNMGMLFSVPSQEQCVVVVKVELFILFDEDKSDKVNNKYVDDYMKGNDRYDFFSVKAIFIPIYSDGHFSLVMVINPNGKLVIL